MKLYHGTNRTSAIDIWKNGIDLSKSKPYLDFGPGFYTTSDKSLAVGRAINNVYKLNRHNKEQEKPYVVILKIDNEELFCDYVDKVFLSMMSGLSL